MQAISRPTKTSTSVTGRKTTSEKKRWTSLQLSRLDARLPRSKGPPEEFEEVKSTSVKPAAAGPLHPLARLRGRNLALGFAGVSPLPKMLHTTLKYAEHFGLTGVSGALGLYVYNASSLYDPNYTGTGHQPRGFDQLMPLYDHFVVLRSRIRTVMVDAGTGYDAVAGVALSSTVTNQGDWDDYAEGPRCVAGSLGYTTTSGHATPHEFRMDYDARRDLGIPDPITADKLQGTISANPTDNAFYHIFVQDGALGASCVVRTIVQIEYDVVFIEPLNPSQS